MRSRFLLAFLTLVVAVLAGGLATSTFAWPEGQAASDAVVNADAAAVDAAESGDSAVPIMLGVRGPAAAEAYAHAREQGASRAEAAQAGREQKARNEQAQQTLLHALTRDRVQVLYRVQSALNGVAVLAAPSRLAELAQLPNVVSVQRIALQTPDNASTVPLIGAPSAWQNLGETGTGITIGVIDTGIDYVHTNFGGPGTAAALTDARSAGNNPQQNDSAPSAFTVSSGGTQLFPSAKVAGGFDFAGDTYNADSTSPSFNPTPRRDPNPEDCPSSLGGGHGSHVSGTAAGYGVNGDGTTYTGGYSSVPFSSLRIGPGVAPEAKLYALRVFGCQGSTSLTTQAIDWAVDPNHDGDVSDHLDVINMSLGSAYGTPDDPSAAASNNAAAAGVVVVTSAGNSNDVYYVSGSPGSARRALSTASGVDEVDVTDGFRIDAPAAIAGVYGGSRSSLFDWTGKPDVSTTLYYPSTNQYGCSAWTGTDKTNIAGRVVLVDWKKPADATFPCGSAVRANNATTAGAAGIIMVDTTPYLDTAIAGNASIPAYYTTSLVGDALKSQLTAGVVSTTQITLSAQYNNSVRLVTPGRADTVSTFSSRGPQGRGNGLKPDITAEGQGVFSTDAGTGTQGRSLNGTSMASPHMAGVMALLRQQHPSWSVEELKALAMNTASHDLYTGFNQTGTRYGPGRVGAGRVDVPDATASDVVAYDADSPGAVSVSFGAVEVLGTSMLQRTIRVVNHGSTDATYALGIRMLTSIPGVSYSLPDGVSLTVPAGGSSTFQVQLTATASAMRNTRDATVVGSQGGNPRQWLSEASGLVTLTPASGPTLRVPVYATARPASSMGTSEADVLFSTGTASTTLHLDGQQVNTGAANGDWRSLVTPFELAATSPQASLPAGTSQFARDADLRYVGATAARTNAANASRINNSTVYFALGTWGNWSTPATEVGFTVFVDVDRNGTDDYQLFNTRFTDTDVFVTAVAKLPASSGPVQGFTNIFSSNLPTGAFNSNMLVMPVNFVAQPATGSATGVVMPTGQTRFNYRVVAASRFWGTIDSTGWLTYDYANPGIDFSGGAAAAPSVFDFAGGTLPAAFNKTAYDANGSQGVLLLHHLNAGDSKAQVLSVLMPKATTTTVDAATFQYSDPLTLTAHVGGGPNGTHSPEGTVEFFVNGVSVGSAPVGSAGTATLGGVANFRGPGSYNVTATYTSSSAYFTGSSTAAAATLTVTQEDARPEYTGPNVVQTPNPNNGSFTVPISATVRDISATADAAGDTSAGDIRNATLTIVDRATNTAIPGCASLPLTLVSAADTTTATAACTWSGSIATDGQSFALGLKVEGWYSRDSQLDDAFVTIIRPGTTLAGGGYLVNQASGGSKAGDAGQKTHFGFNAKSQKSGGYLGSSAVTVTSGGRIYRVKSNSISGLTLGDCSPAPCRTATLNANKATIQDVTDPLNPVTVESQATIAMAMTDRGETDSLAITVKTKTGSLWFSSNWNGTQTVEQQIARGSIRVGQ